MDEKQKEESLEENFDENFATEEESNLPLFGRSEDVLTRYTRCEVCGSHLHFSHFTDFNQNLTQESAKCPECGFKSPQRTHRLQ